MMNNTRPVGVLRYNAEVMRDNGAPQEVIAKYLSDNGSSIDQIMAVAKPNENELQRMLDSEKDGSFQARQQQFNDAVAKVQKDEERMQFLRNTQGDIRSVADGLLLGAGDELESAVTGQPVADIRQEQAEFVKENPVRSTAFGITGALLNPVAPKGINAFKGAGLGSKIANSALQGAGYGAVYGFNSGEDGLVNRLVNAGSSAAVSGAVSGAIPAAGAGIKKALELGADVAGLASGAGGETLKRAYDAGTRNSQVFKDTMRGKNSVYDVTFDTDKAVKAMEKARGAAYKAALPADKASIELDIKPVKEALKAAKSEISGVTKGVDDVAEKSITKVNRLLRNIKKDGGLNFENAEEVKKALDGIIEPLKRSGESNTVRILTPIRSALIDEMDKKVPQYAKARQGFSNASGLIDAIKSAFTSKDRTTELRKLQGMTRQSVAAAQGGKQELGKILDEVSGKRILDAVAGGQVTNWLPRDFVRTAVGAGAAVRTGNIPATLGTVAGMSPRLQGEIAFALGRAAGKLSGTGAKASAISKGKEIVAIQQLLNALKADKKPVNVAIPVMVNKY